MGCYCPEELCRNGRYMYLWTVLIQARWILPWVGAPELARHESPLLRIELPNRRPTQQSSYLNWTHSLDLLVGFGVRNRVDLPVLFTQNHSNLLKRTQHIACISQQILYELRHTSWEKQASSKLSQERQRVPNLSEASLELLEAFAERLKNAGTI